ncbi:MAG: hypothetical protein GWN55_04190, partial [Phycisphaerae bacterium]|nr:hypothetical protein [Phycisphaerae bacterium]NIV70834.1 hypothetical protein [Phycisphaerae bacterium]
CSCRYLSPSEAFREADVVFSGHVAKNTGAGLLSRSVTFTVTESWKGVSTSRVTVYSTGDSGSCGFPFAVGTAYLVYGREVNGRLFTSLCTRTSSVSMPRVKDDFAYLNSWARFAPGSGGLTLDMICFGGSGLILLVSAIGYLLFRRRRMAA